jgi:single-stranded DNA-specific DHH superfamily exonuclease
LERDAAAEIARLRKGLYDIIYLDHHNHGPESRATAIARAALLARGETTNG